MRHITWSLLVVAVLLGVHDTGQAAADAALKLGFRADKSAAMAEAARDNKHVLAFFTTDWCSWCRRLEADVLSTTEFQQGGAGWVKVLIDAEKGDGVDWAKRFNVSGFPTLILLDPQGEEIDRLAGYLPMPDFLKTLQDYQKGIGTLSALQARQQDFPKDLSLGLAIARKLEDRGQVDKARLALQAIVQADSVNAQGFTDEAEANLAMMDFRKDKNPAALERVLMRWPGMEQGPQIYNVLIGMAAKAGDDTRMQRLLNEAIAAYPEDVALLNSYAWTCAEKGWDLERALEVARRAVALSGDEPNVLDTLSEVQYRMGRPAEAIATIQQALAKRPGDPYLEGQLKRFQAPKQ